MRKFDLSQFQLQVAHMLHQLRLGVAAILVVLFLLGVCVVNSMSEEER